MTEAVKVCQKCREIKELDSFSRHSHRPDGRQVQCKACFQAYYRSREEELKLYSRDRYHGDPKRSNVASAKWQAENRERSNAIKARWLARNGDKHRAADKRYREADPERERLKSLRWHRANPERVAAKSKRYANSHPEAGRQADARRSGQRRASGGTISPNEWRTILADSLGLCVYCTMPRRLTLEHISPISRGGRHDVDNVAAACRSCNSSKNATPLLVWMARRMAA